MHETKQEMTKVVFLVKNGGTFAKCSHSLKTKTRAYFRRENYTFEAFKGLKILSLNTSNCLIEMPLRQVSLYYFYYVVFCFNL